MITTEDMQRLLGPDTRVIGDDGSKIGTMGEVFLDTASGEPAWVTVHTGMFGSARSFVPLVGAVTRGDEIHVPFGKDVVKHAPQPESPGGRLSPDEERELYRHYGLLHDDVAPAPVATAPVATPAASATPAPAPVPARAEATTDAAPAPDDGSMVRSEERLRVVGTERVPTERVRMRTYTVTEEKQVTVPVRREELRLEYDPAEPGAAAEIVDDPTSSGTRHDAADPGRSSGAADDRA